MLIEAAKCSCSPPLLSTICQLGRVAREEKGRAHDASATSSLNIGQPPLPTTWECIARASSQLEGEGGGGEGGGGASVSAGFRQGGKNLTKGRCGSDATSKAPDANTAAAQGSRAVVAVVRPAVPDHKQQQLARALPTHAERPMHSHTSLRSITPPRNSRILISQPPMRI